MSISILEHAEPVGGVVISRDHDDSRLDRIDRIKTQPEPESPDEFLCEAEFRLRSVVTALGYVERDLAGAKAASDQDEPWCLRVGAMSARLDAAAGQLLRALGDARQALDDVGNAREGLREEAPQ